MLLMVLRMHACMQPCVCMQCERGHLLDGGLRRGKLPMMVRRYERGALRPVPVQRMQPGRHEALEGLRLDRGASIGDKVALQCWQNRRAHRVRFAGRPHR